MVRREEVRGEIEDDVELDRATERMIRMLRPLAASGAAPETMLITMTVASLMPVLQATMSFVEATNHGYRQSLAESGALTLASLPLVTESARRILTTPTREAAAVSSAMARRDEYQPQPLAVT